MESSHLPATEFKDDRLPSAQYRILLQLAVPVILSQVSHTFMGLADVILVGQTGDVTMLAASALANNVFSVPIVFAIGLSYGATPKVAEYFAQKNYGLCQKILSNSLLNNLLWTFLLCGLLYALLPFAGLMGQDPQVLKQAVPFFQLLIWGLPGIMLFQTFRQFYDGLGRTRPGMVASVAANVLNVVLNYLLIYGKCGFPALGLLGSGIATLIARSCMGLGLMAYFYWDLKAAIWHKGLFSNFVEKNVLKLLNQMGIPIALQFLFEVGAFSFTAVIIGQMGTHALAAHQVVISIASVTYMVASGLAAAASIRVGHFVGLKDKEMIRLSGVRSMQMVSLLMAFTALVFIGFRNWIPLVFIDDPQVVVASSGLFIIAGIFQISDGIQVVGLGCLRGLSDVRIPTLITFIAYWIIAIPLGYWLGIGLGWGISGTWWALLTGLSVSALFMYLRFFTLLPSFTFQSAPAHISISNED